MGIDEEIFVMRNGRPITYLKFRHGHLFLSYEDGYIESEEVKLLDTDFTGHWISGDSFLKVLANLEDYVSYKENADYLRTFFKENPVLPTDRVLYKLETS